MTDNRDKARQSGHMGVGSRLKEQPAEELLNTAFAHEVGDGPLLYQAMSLTDLAYVIMLKEEGLLPQDAGAALLRGLLTLHAIPPDEFPYDPIFGDIYTNREQKLREVMPPTEREQGFDGWLRAGRARRESSTVGYQIVVREGLLKLAGALGDLLATLCTLAERHRETLMPDYTYLQKAHPTTLAHYLLTFAMPLCRDMRRVQSAYANANECAAGGGSVNGSRLALNRGRVAALLGFGGVITHTRDAMWQADIPVEILAAAVAMLVTADRLAEDLYLFATEEFGYLTLADAHSRTSVIMPQKKNPYSLAYVRGAARHVPTILQSVIATNMTPSGQPDNRLFPYGEVPRALDLTTRVISLMSGLLKRAEFHTERLSARAGAGFSGATDLGDYLSEAAGLDPRTAHKVIGYAIRTMLEMGIPTESDPILTTEALDAAAQVTIGRTLALPADAVRDAQDPLRIVASRRGLGGASPTSVTPMIAEGRALADALRGWVEGETTRLAAAESALIALAESMSEAESG
ncbi:MAG TPA: lyase family protein [Aggregatilineales bacterium]|nr:hypothetical protein [Anaerolineales bacterium]HRE46756.1 lyase family protein [Aggregatilineales bacterium]